MTIIVGLCAFIAVALGAFVLLSQGVSAADKYENAFIAEADKNLSEMFIFIDPRKIYIANIVILAFVSLGVGAATSMWPLAAVLAAIATTLPQWLYRIIKRRREKRFNHALPDMLASTASMLKSGTNVSNALETMVQETQGPISEEFGLFLRELAIGVEFNAALDNLYQRMSLGDLQLVVAAMKISREIGGSLADVLARLAETIRRRIEMEGKIDSLTSMGKMQGWVMGLLPIVLGVVIYPIEPEAMGRLWTGWVGWMFCAAIIIFEILGFYFIKKIVTIDV